MTTMIKRRRQRGEGAVYPHTRDGKGNPVRWAGQVELGCSSSGQRRRRTIYGRTQAEVVKKIATLRRQLVERGDLPTADMTVAKWLEHWLREIATDRLKPNTLRSYKTAVNKHIVPSLGRQRLGTLSAQHVRQMHRDLKDRGLSSTTALNAHRILSVALNDAMREGAVPRNVAAIVRAPSKAVSTRTGLTGEEAIAALKVAAGLPLGSRWLAAFLLGVRQGERLGLRWSHLDLEAGVADLSWALQRVTYSHGCVPRGATVTCGKKRGASCPQRRLDIPDGMEHDVLAGNLVLMRPKTEGSIRVVALIEPLRLALLRRQEEVERQRPGYAVDHDLVWCTDTGGPIDPRDDWSDWRALLTAAKVPLVTLHEARHTTATLLLELGVDPKVVQQLLGHSSVAVSQGYQHVSLALQREALGDLGRRLELPEADADA